MNILVINGPNLNMIGEREKSIYGTGNYEDLCNFITTSFKNEEVNIDFFQSNIEGEIIHKIHKVKDNFHGLVINPGAFTHYSYAIYDALLCLNNIKIIEVHISNIHKREEFRKKSVTAPACIGQITGFGFFSYILAIDYLLKMLNF